LAGPDGDLWTVYVLRCGDDSFYTGIAKDPAVPRGPRKPENNASFCENSLYGILENLLETEFGT